jgi:hypothetical protein
MTPALDYTFRAGSGVDNIFARKKGNPHGSDDHQLDH